MQKNKSIRPHFSSEVPFLLLGKAIHRRFALSREATPKSVFIESKAFPPQPALYNHAVLITCHRVKNLPALPNRIYLVSDYALDRLRQYPGIKLLEQQRHF